MTNQNLSKIANVVLVSLLALAAVFECGLRPAVHMVAHSMNGTVDYKRMATASANGRLGR